MDSSTIRLLRKENGTHEKVLQLGWYHSFRFEDGTEITGALSVDTLQKRFSMMPIPSDLTGKRVLDIGTWDGWFSFEAERHGADVTAIDLVERPTFMKARQKLGSRVEFKELDIFELIHEELRPFDFVFFLGVLYHTKHPLLALEIVCSLTQEVAIVESYVTDGDTWDRNRNEIPKLEFYEADELGGQLDNWYGPTVGCLVAMCRAAGFARTVVIEVAENRALLACYRAWARIPATNSEAVVLKSVRNSIWLGINFRRTRDEYLTWCVAYGGAPFTRDDIRLEVGGFGVPPLSVVNIGSNLWSVNSRLPFGMAPGWYSLRLSVRGSDWSNVLKIAVDLVPIADAIKIDLVCDGRTWARGEADASAMPGMLSLWVSGLGDNSDETNTTVLLNETRLKVTYVSDSDENGSRQVNADLPDDVTQGLFMLTARFGGAESPSSPLFVRIART